MKGELAQLDALYPMIRVSSDDEKQQTHDRRTAMHKSTHRGDVEYKSYQEQNHEDNE